jgi:hypothetical protein
MKSFVPEIGVGFLPYQEKLLLLLLSSLLKTVKRKWITKIMYLTKNGTV